MPAGMTQIDAPLRRRRGGMRLWASLVFAGGLAALALVAATAPLRQNPYRDLQRELRELRQVVQESGELPDATTSLSELLRKSEAAPRLLAECEFLVGSYYYQRGETEPAKTELFAKADEHFAHALTLTVGEKDLPALLFRLGMARYRLGQNATQALNLISQGLELGVDNPGRGYEFLADAYLNLPQPNLNFALLASQRCLEYVDTQNAEAFARARYRQADILHRLDRRGEALQELEAIADAVPTPLLAKVRLLQALCSEGEGNWANAVAFWKSLEPVAGEVPGGRGRVLYALGLAQAHIEPFDQTKIEDLWKEAAKCGGEEAQAASIRLGHLLLLGSRPEPETALMLWSDALADIRVAGDYKNTYLPLSAALELFDQGRDRLLETNDFPRVQTLGTLVSRIAPPGTAEEKLAQAYYGWAKDLAEKAERTPTDREALLRESRARFQDAGDAFKHASLTQNAESKVESLWQCAYCYIMSRDYANAAMALERFIGLTKNDPRQAQGHFALADAYLAQNQRAKARPHYLKCIELNTPPYLHRALAKLAQIDIESRKLDSAREILLQIISRNGPDLERAIYEQTLFSLGKVLFDLGEPDEGAVRLREAIRQFPNNPAVWTVREQLANHAWDRAMQISLAELQAAAPERRPIVEAMLQKRRQHLKEAHNEFQALVRDLRERLLERTPASAVAKDETVIYRNAQFKVGQIKIELGEFAEALEYGRSLQLAYRGSAESLFAASQVYQCWKRLAAVNQDRPQLQQIAMDTLQTALRDLDDIPRDRDDDVFLSGPQPFSRDQWRQFLRAWEGELQHTALRPNPRTFAPQQ